MWVHQWDPFLIFFSKSFPIEGIRWYGLAYLLGFLFSYYLILKMTRTGRIDLKPNQVSDFVTVGAIGAMLGGRLGYGLFYRPELFLQWGDSFPYWGILEINRGGMASHGGIIGVLLACIIFGHLRKMPKLQLVDLSAIGAGIGLFVGRLANFINGELFGRVTEVAWYSVKFPQEMYLWLERSQFDKLKSLGSIAEKISPIPAYGGGSLAVDTLTWQNWVDRFSYISRGNIENYISYMIRVVQSTTSSAQDQMTLLLSEVLSPRYASQIYQAFMEGFFVFIFLVFLWRKPQKSGVISGWFAFSYSVTRIIGEQFRLPDAHLGYGLLGLTRGQWLSVGLLILSVCYLIFAYRRKSDLKGGW